MRNFTFKTLGLAALLAVPSFGSTFYAGVEDWPHLDYDYNDTVISLSGNNLNLQSKAQFYSEPTLGTSGSPFWNHSSLDAANDNIGYCIYGGGACNGGMAIADNSKYLAANQTSTGSANDVTFRVDGSVELKVMLQNTMAKNVIGWYSLTDPSTLYWLNPNSANGTYTFTPGGAFGIVAQTTGHNTGEGPYTYFSQSNLGSQDVVSHFAFFGTPAVATVPEPGAYGLVLFGLSTCVATVLRRKGRI